MYLDSHSSHTHGHTHTHTHARTHMDASAETLEAPVEHVGRKKRIPIGRNVVSTKMYGIRSYYRMRESLAEKTGAKWD